MLKPLVIATFLVAGLTACGSDPDVSDSQVEDAATSSESSETQSDEEAGTIVETGFGQQNEYAWVMAVVHNNSDHAGQTVTVNFNLKDATGELVASGHQVAAFNWPGQDLPVATQVDLGRGVKAKTIEATVLVEDEGTFDDQVSEEWPTTEGTIYKVQYGGWGAKFEVQNPTAEPLEGAGFEVVCHNREGKIIGGGVNYPELIPASGSILVDMESLYTDAKPDACTGYLHPWM